MITGLLAVNAVTASIITVHVIVSMALIVLILLHSGRGGGLSDMFGGMGSVAAGSTVVERNLDRITIAAALLFGFTTLILALRMQ
ncbi:MAG: preprotein translocase subunit SecG [Actinomycetota bacterium]